MNIIIKLCHKIFKRTLGIYRLSSDKMIGTIISKDFIKDVTIHTDDVLENGKYYYHSRIKITTLDDHEYDVNTHEIYVRYIPDIPHKMGIRKYNKCIMRLIKSPFCDYTLEHRPNIIFEPYF